MESENTVANIMLRGIVATIGIDESLTMLGEIEGKKMPFVFLKGVK